MVADFGESNLRFLDEGELEKRLDYYTRLLKKYRDFLLFPDHYLLLVMYFVNYM